MANINKAIGAILLIFCWVPGMFIPEGFRGMTEDQLLNIFLWLSGLTGVIGVFFIILSQPHAGPEPVEAAEPMSASEYNSWKKDNPTPPPVYPPTTKDKFVERVFQSDHERRAIENEREWHAHEARQSSNKKNNGKRVQ